MGWREETLRFPGICLPIFDALFSVLSNFNGGRSLHSRHQTIFSSQNNDSKQGKSATVRSYSSVLVRRVFSHLEIWKLCEKLKWLFLYFKLVSEKRA